MNILDSKQEQQPPDHVDEEEDYGAQPHVTHDTASATSDVGSDGRPVDPTSMAPGVKKKKVERITIIRGAVICARNLAKDMNIGDGISLTETDIKRTLDELNPEAWRKYEKRERARAARGTLNPWMPRWMQTRKPLRNDKDAFGEAELGRPPNPYLVVRGVDNEGKGYDLTRTEALMNTNSPCWDILQLYTSSKKYTQAYQFIMKAATYGGEIRLSVFRGGVWRGGMGVEERRGRWWGAGGVGGG